MPAVGNAEITISELGPKGDGTFLGPRGNVYVERAVPGDRLRARLYKDGAVSRAEIVEILTPSTFRQNPPCPHYEACGNCTLQHLSADYYRRWKMDLVKEAFAGQGLRPRTWLSPIFLEQHSRRRATFTALKRKERLILGYYRRRSQEVTDIETCLIAAPEFLAVKDRIKPLLRPILHENEPVDIFLQMVGESVDLVVTGSVVSKKALDHLKGQVTRASWRLSEKSRLETVFTRGPLRAQFGALQVALPPAAFLQPTAAGEKALVEAVLSALPKKEILHLADLFSGCGTFSGPLLEHGSVDAYESVSSAVQALTQAGRAQRLRVFRRDLFRHPLRREEINRYDAVIFDPPRGGCPEQAASMSSAKTRTLIGVSCNPATFARDARILCDGGYRLHSLQLVDQFLWSHHVEMVGVFTR